MGLTATLFTWETEVRVEDVGRPPFLLKEGSTLPATVLPVFLCTALTPGTTVELFGMTGGGGLQSGGGMEVLEVLWDGFFQLIAMPCEGGRDAAEVAVEGGR